MSSNVAYIQMNLEQSFSLKTKAFVRFEQGILFKHVTKRTIPFFILPSSFINVYPTHYRLYLAKI